MSDNPPAFPTEWSPGLAPGEAMQTGINTAQFPGMTLRDWFAGQALAGISSNERLLHGIDKASKGTPREYTAQIAYAIADAMLAERGRQP